MALALILRPGLPLGRPRPTRADSSAPPNSVSTSTADQAARKALSIDRVRARASPGRPIGSLEAHLDQSLSAEAICTCCEFTIEASAQGYGWRDLQIEPGRQERTVAGGARAIDRKP